MRQPPITPRSPHLNGVLAAVVALASGLFTSTTATPGPRPAPRELPAVSAGVAAGERASLASCRHGLAHPEAVVQGRAGDLRADPGRGQRDPLLIPPVALVGCWPPPSPGLVAVGRLVAPPGRSLRVLFCSWLT